MFLKCKIFRHYPFYFTDIELCDGEVTASFDVALGSNMNNETQCDCAANCEGVTFVGKVKRKWQYYDSISSQNGNSGNCN